MHENRNKIYTKIYGNIHTKLYTSRCHLLMPSIYVMTSTRSYTFLIMISWHIASYCSVAIDAEARLRWWRHWTRHRWSLHAPRVDNGQRFSRIGSILALHTHSKERGALACKRQYSSELSSRSKSCQPEFYVDAPMYTCMLFGLSAFFCQGLLAKKPKTLPPSGGSPPRLC